MTFNEASSSYIYLLLLYCSSHLSCSRAVLNSKQTMLHLHCFLSLHRYMHIIWWLIHSPISMSDICNVHDVFILFCIIVRGLKLIFPS